MCWSEGDLAYLHYGDHSSHGKAGFLLQRFYLKEFAENFMLHLLMKTWMRSGQTLKKIAEKYGVHANPLEQRRWKMRDFVLFDPSGVLWRIAQDTP